MSLPEVFSAAPPGFFMSPGLSPAPLRCHHRLGLSPVGVGRENGAADVCAGLGYRRGVGYRRVGLAELSGGGRGGRAGGCPVLGLLVVPSPPALSPSKSSAGPRLLPEGRGGRRWWRWPPERVVPPFLLWELLRGEPAGVRGRWKLRVAPASLLEVLTSVILGDACFESVRDNPL